jgi:hypothetical protein
MLGAEIITSSRFRIPYLGVLMPKTYVVGRKFVVTAHFVNHDTAAFLGGNVDVVWRWQNGLAVTWTIRLPSLAPNEHYNISFGETDVLDDSPALFYVDGIPTANLNQHIQFCHVNGTSIQPQPPQAGALAGWYHIHTIIPKRAEELYQLWAILVAIAALIPIATENIVIPILKWLIGLN